MAGIPSFNAFTYRTVDGETITATKKDGVVTLVGDKNGVRQLPLDEFKKEFLATVPKLERTPETDTVSFSGTNNPEPQERKEAGSGKKWGVGIASAVIPGLGQAINGEWGKAAGFFLGTYVGAGAVGFMIHPFLGAAVAIGANIWSIVDAVKNAKAD